MLRLLLNVLSIPGYNQYLNNRNITRQNDTILCVCIFTGRWQETMPFFEVVRRLFWCRWVTTKIMQLFCGRASRLRGETPLLGFNGTFSLWVTSSILSHLLAKNCTVAAKESHFFRLPLLPFSATTRTSDQISAAAARRSRFRVPHNIRLVARRL
jgi:hypothetical protein